MIPQASCGPGPAPDGTGRTSRALRSPGPRPCRRRARRASPRVDCVGETAKPWFWRGDEHPVRRALEHRVVRAAVAERELVGLVAGRERRAAGGRGRSRGSARVRSARARRRLVRERLGVAGAVREEDAVVAGELVRVDVVRKDRDRGAGPGEPVAGSSACSRSRRPRSARGPRPSRRTARGSRPSPRARGPPSTAARAPRRAPRRPKRRPRPPSPASRPASRRCSTSERVSIPVSATTPCSCEPVRPGRARAPRA